MKKAYYTTETVNDHITAIWSACGEVMYLICGEKRALLMDTNLGVGHLKELVDSLTDKPYDVVLTHGHIDHAPGASEFEHIYMNRADIPIYLESIPLEERLGYLQANLGERFSDYGFTPEDFTVADPDMVFHDLENGMVFDLGGLHVEMIAFPGHTPGSMALFIPEDRILITGDACNDSTFLFDDRASTVEAYRAQVNKVRQELAGRFDRVLICHHAIDTGADILDNMADLCDDILAGRTDDLPFHFRSMEAYIAKDCSPTFKRTDGRSGNLIYSREKVRG